MRILAFLTISIITITSAYNQTNWKLKKAKNGIIIYTSKVDGFQHESFKSVMEVTGTVDEFTALLKDIDNFPKWGYNTKQTYLLESIGDTVQIYYNESSAPFPFSNRDGIYQNIFRWNSKTKTLIVDVLMLDDYMDEIKGIVRVLGNGEWKVRVLGEDKIEITFIMNIDPGGSIPPWLSNMFNDEGPYHSMKKLREIIESDKYKGITYDFIKLDLLN